MDNAGYNAHTKQHVSFCALNKKEKETKTEKQEKAGKT